MSNESVEVLLARMDERLKNLSLIQTNESQGRARLETTLDRLQETCNQMDSRLQQVEQSLARSAPTIEEFITIKHKVVGAGIAGKWIWLAGGAILTLLITFRAELFKWLSR